MQLVFQGTAPAGTELTLRQELPAGVQVDVPRQEASLREGSPVSYAVEDGAVRFTLAPKNSVSLFQVNLYLVPTLAGTFQAGAASLSVSGREDTALLLPPSTWTIR